jgi:hypothetical protein
MPAAEYMSTHASDVILNRHTLHTGALVPILLLPKPSLRIEEARFDRAFARWLASQWPCAYRPQKNHRAVT